MGCCWFYVQNKKLAPTTSNFRWKLAVARLARTSWERAAAQNWCAVGSVGKVVEVALVFDADIIIIIIIIIRVCFHSWQRKPSLDRSHRCLFLADLDHKGPICLVRSVCWHTLYKRKNLLTLLSLVLCSTVAQLRWDTSSVIWAPAHRYPLMSKGGKYPKSKLFKRFPTLLKWSL